MDLDDAEIRVLGCLVEKQVVSTQTSLPERVARLEEQVAELQRALAERP